MLASGFIEQDDARDIFFDFWRIKEDVAVVSAVFGVVRNASGFEFFVDGATGFVGGKNALLGRH